ncbi:MAG: hypothetical protein KA401_04260 [Anaerolineae bacterium]|nr:hypothetical protein [Anaerolineae bacterium]
MPWPYTPSRADSILRRPLDNNRMSDLQRKLNRLFGIPAVGRPNVRDRADTFEPTISARTRQYAQPYL